MNKFFPSTLILTFSIFLVCCQGQNHQNPSPETEIFEGPAFENSEFTYYGIPEKINPIDTSPGWNQKGQKILLTGIVYQYDGITPAADVLLYYYHTNTDGKYLHSANEKRSMPPNELGQTHGYIRGWVKTDTDGKYSIYTVRPGTYPTRDEPDHIHITVKEPNNIREYYIDDAVFDDDKLLTSAKRRRMENRGGSGILRMAIKDDLLIGERNIILGLNIPEYPVHSNHPDLLPGKKIGEDVSSFIPFHAWGPDKGTKTCPVCKYGWYHGILYFVGNNPDWSEIKVWLTYLENESRIREKYLKVYFVYGNEKNYNKNERASELAALGSKLALKKVALTFVPSFSDSESEIASNNIDQSVENTFILYRRNRIIAKYVNLKPNQTNFDLIGNSLDKTINEYFDLPGLKPGS